MWGRVCRYDAREVEQPLRFQGQYWDAETGFHYNRHRYYDPDAARLITQNPIGLMGGKNLYVYGVNPIRAINPLGLSTSIWQQNWEAVHGPLPTGYQVHHVIPKDAKTVAAAKRLCPNFDEHAESNLIALPNGGASQPLKTGTGFGKQYHDGYHKGYSDAAFHALKVANRLKIPGVSGCAKLKAIQASLRGQLQIGGPSMYKGPNDLNAKPVTANWLNLMRSDIRGR